MYNKTREKFVTLKDKTVLRLENKNYPKGEIVINSRNDGFSFVFVKLDKKSDISMFKNNPQLFYNFYGYIDKMLEECFKLIKTAFCEGYMTYYSTNIICRRPETRYSFDDFRREHDLKSSVSNKRIADAISNLESKIFTKRISEKNVRSAMDEFSSALDVKFKIKGRGHELSLKAAICEYFNMTDPSDRVNALELYLHIPTCLTEIKEKRINEFEEFRNGINMIFSRDRIRREVIRLWNPNLDFDYTIKTDQLNAIAFDDKNRIRKMHWDSTHRIMYSLDGLDRDSVDHLLFYHERYDRLLDLEYPFYGGDNKKKGKCRGE